MKKFVPCGGVYLIDKVRKNGLRSVMEQHKISKSVERNSDFIYAFGVNKIMATIIGTWPLGCQDIFSKIRFITTVFLHISLSLSLIGENLIECSSANDLAASMCLVASAILSLTKIISLRCRFCPKILAIVVSAMNDWSNVMNPRAQGIMKNHAKLGRFVCIFQMTSAYSSAVLLVIGALPSLGSSRVNVTMTNDSETVVLRGLPLSTVCFYGEMSNILYAIVFTTQAIQLLLLCTGNIGNDVFFFGITMHLCGQFQLLGEDLERLGINVNEKKGHDEIVERIERHLELVRLARYIEDSFNFIILLQLSANTSQICVMGVQMILSSKTGDVVMMVNSVVCISVLTLQLFWYSYAGDLLSSKIENLGVSAYSSTWYDLPPKLMRDVMFIILRNQKSFNVTAGKVYRIDIENFKNLMKALGSYFSVLRVMFDA